MAQAGLAALCLVAVGAGLAACNLTSMVQGNDSPDAVDRVRSTDLSPRFPGSAEVANTGSPKGGLRSSSYYGSGTADPIEVTAPTARSSGEGYELNFENTPVTTVAKVILHDILGVGYTIDPRVQGTVSLASGRPVPKDDVLFVLESTLRTANVVLARDAAGYRLLPAAEAVGSGGIDRVSADSRPEPGYGVTVIPLQFVSVQTVTKLLDSFAMKAGTIRADSVRNLLLIQGSGAERRAAVETVLSFDADWMRGQSVGIYPVRNTTPEPLIAELEKIMDSGEGGLGQGLVKFQPVGRLNAIMVVSRKPELLRNAATWINRLDSSDVASTGVKVYRVRYGEARQLARLLNDMFVGGGGAGAALDAPTNQIAPGGGTTSLSSTERLSGGMSAPTTSGVRPQVLAVPDAAANPANAASALNAGANSLAGGRGAGGSSGSAILPGVRITPDVVNNALLIYANQENYRIIERTLNQLDRPQLQVAIDMTIAEVTLNDNLNYGVQFFLKSQDFGAPVNTGSALNTAASAVLAQTLPGFNFLVGSALEPRVILNALHAYTDVKVLSNPSLVVVDNQTATLQVGDQVPVTTGSATVLSTSNTVVNTIDYRNTGIILRVVPRVNSGGKVLLDVEQEISNVANNANSGTLTPTLSQRKVKSSVAVTSGQTVLLAGLISETQTRSRSGIPLLDQLPGVGDAFTQNLKGISRTELIIFIRPQIIRDGVDASVVAEELRSKMRGGKVGSTNPPGAVVPRAPSLVR
jgi:general secretion pathway protein D